MFLVVFLASFLVIFFALFLASFPLLFHFFRILDLLGPLEKRVTSFCILSLPITHGICRRGK